AKEVYSVMTPLGHRYANGVCKNCGEADPSAPAKTPTTPTNPTTPTTPNKPTNPSKPETPSKPSTSTQPGTTAPNKPATPSAGKTNPFTDVPDNAYYKDAVLWALENGVTTGVTATEFRPNAACTRGQVVTFLWRAKGCPEPKTKTNPFTDVSSSSAFYKAILWAAENNITTGTTSSTFNPGGTCTSGHVVTFLWRANGKPAASGSSSLASANPGKYYTNAVAWADTNGLLNGTAFVPGSQSPRADIVTYLYRDIAG
ncbi:MAG: S-layer homology domain-containing protein, partial [Oscillibacter sp.]|nr:S-layer homology domain-containing protein [Oscillibacter sp.]